MRRWAEYKLSALNENFHISAESHLLDQQFGQAHATRVSDFDDLCMNNIHSVFSFLYVTTL
jgi:hypothetical protein